MPDSVNILSLHQKAKLISLETRSNTLVDFSRIPGFMNDTVEFVKELLEDKEDLGKVEVYRDNAVSKLLKNVDYLTLEKIEIFRPTGMKNYYVDYVSMLVNIQEQLSMLDQQIFIPINTLLASLLADPSRLEKDVVLSGVRRINVEKITQQMQKEISSDDTGDKILYKHAVKRNKDWLQIIGQLNSVNEKYNSVPNKHLLNRIKEVSGNLDLLMTRMKEMPQTYTHNKKAIADIVDTVYYCAKVVELYALHGFNIRTCQVAIDDSYKQLEQAIE